MSIGAIGLKGQGASFAAAGAAFVVDIVVSVAGHAGHHAANRSPSCGAWSTR